jgi:hypothetical protein
MAIVGSGAEGGREESGLIRRILASAGDPDLAQRLTERLSPSDLQSLLLRVYKARAAALGPADVLRRYAENRFVKPPGVPPLDSMRLDALAFSLLPDGFEVVELSPLSPLGASSALGPVDQDKIVSTIRNTEVLSDPTNAMALECALRRSRAPRPGAGEIKLACSQRLVRAQSISGPAAFAHFRMLALCTSGRDSGSLGFELGAALEHIEFFLRLFEALDADGYAIGPLRLKLVPFSAPLEELARGRLLAALAERSPGLRIEIDGLSAEKRGYYSGLRYQLFARDDSGEELFIVDGGTTDWTQKLLADRKERFMTSGMGSERFLACFRRRAAAREG